ncbi:MAG: DUF11 domain-containing protein, partial [Planctomycetaceae bacterium]|nr:DUF11 domain-containing protein [Planctomycetaceae bacterium]
DWVRTGGRVNGFEFQPVRVELPSEGKVTWFLGARDDVKEAAQVKLAVGQSYRVKLSDMPEFPGIELYPSVEMLDRLHPPAGHADTFALPLAFTIEELEAAVEGRMVTKVIYVEQPQLALPFELTTDIAIRTVNARANLIEEADKSGRPLALIRLGGRIPALNETQGAFFGNGAPVLASKGVGSFFPSGQTASKTVTEPNGRSEKDSRPRFTAAETRIQLDSHADAQEVTRPKFQQNREGLVAADPSLADQFPDEYLFDGGDRDYPVHYDSDIMVGIETEDTVAEFQNHKGKRKVKASNRVAIYAPRFAAVRTVHGVREGVNVQRVAANLDDVHGAGLRQKVGAKTGLQRDRLQGVRMRSRASGIFSQSTRKDVSSAKFVAQHTKLQNVYEDVQFLHDGKIRQNEIARLHGGMNAAATWTRDLNPVLVANLSAAQEVYANFKVAEMTGTDEGHKQPGRLRLVKLADKEAAKPGDVITFTIRFDNLGDRELRHIRLIDNLTPRLEYVDDSATSDMPGSINVDDNGEGSHILRFELDNPLAGHAGGVITFQAKLR